MNGPENTWSLSREQNILGFGQNFQELDPVGSTVRYEVIKLIIDVTGSEEGIYAFIKPAREARGPEGPAR